MDWSRASLSGEQRELEWTVQRGLTGLEQYKWDFSGVGQYKGD